MQMSEKTMQINFFFASYFDSYKNVGGRGILTMHDLKIWVVFALQFCFCMVQRHAEAIVVDVKNSSGSISVPMEMLNIKWAETHHVHIAGWSKLKN